MEILREQPKVSSFVSLAEHQSTTPASFYTGPPVLHYYSDRSKLIILDREAQSNAALTPLLQHAITSQQDEDQAQTNGDANHLDEQRVLEEVDVFVTSEKLLLYSNTAAAGLSIPYPSISLHAIQALPAPSSELPWQGVYMQLMSLANDSTEDIEPESLSITIVPTASAPPGTATETEPTDPVEAEDKPEETPVQALFNALSNCSNLHPDPVDEDDEDEDGSRLIRSGLAMPGDTSGGLPPPMPGSGGWITAENMHEFVDENGDFIDNGDDDNDMSGEGSAAAQEPLGSGAGTVRTREDSAADADGEDESKWQRTS